MVCVIKEELSCILMHDVEISKSLFGTQEKWHFPDFYGMIFLLQMKYCTFLIIAQPASLFTGLFFSLK